ncbi:MAG: hypothetical protein ABMB14_20325 [Myxococcota bacterium]
MTKAMLVGLALSGCGDCAPTVSGGTERERSLVRTYLDAFVGSVEEDAVCLGRVRLAGEASSAGRYDPVTRQVRIRSGLEGGTLQPV